MIKSGLLLAAAFGMAAHASVITFNFDADAVGTSTQFTDTVNGLSATFSSPADPGGFTIQPTIFQALNGNVLGDPGPLGTMDIPLTIDFNQTLSAIALVFATGDFGTPSPFTLSAFFNGTQVGTVSATGVVPGGFLFPEGEIAFSGPAFNSVVLTTTAPTFAIDQVAAAQAPEADAVLLTGLGFALLGLGRFLKRISRRKASTGILATFLAVIPCGAWAQNVLPLPAPSASTVPSNGDVNPYGVAYVPATVPTDGSLQHGNILVSNFNDLNNLQGRGTTIVQITPQGQTTTFFTSTSASVRGLTAALGILSNGIVLAGYLPSVDGTPATLQPGGLLLIDRHGLLLANLTNSLIGAPWGMALYDRGNGTAQAFVSNVRTGNVLRLDISYAANGESATVNDMVTIGSGFTNRVDPAAFVVGPSGLAYDPVHNLLYVANSDSNAIYELTNAGTATTSQGTGTTFIADAVHLHGPLDLALTPTGHLLVADSDGSNADPNQPSELVEYNAAGQFVTQYSVDPNNGGAFGLAIESVGWGTLRVAAVDDNQNTLKVWTVVVL